jgi:hypothetical protein
VLEKSTIRTVDGNKFDGLHANGRPSRTNQHGSIADHNAGMYQKQGNQNRVTVAEPICGDTIYAKTERQK